MPPGRQSGKYKRHLDGTLGGGEYSDSLYSLIIVGHRRHDMSRTSYVLKVGIPQKDLVEEIEGLGELRVRVLALDRAQRGRRGEERVDAVLLRDGRDRVHVGALPEEVHGDDRPDPIGVGAVEGCGQGLRADVVGHGVDVDEDRGRPQPGDRSGGGAGEKISSAAWDDGDGGGLSDVNGYRWLGGDGANPRV